MFATFKDLLTRHKLLVAQFLADTYKEVCACVCVWGGALGPWGAGGGGRG